MGQPAQSNVDVTIGATGFNPYRTSQFVYNDTWKNAGMSKVAGDSYLGAIKDSLDSPNMILDLRIPQNQKYQQVVLDEAIARFLAGEIDKEATVKAVLSGWNDLNEQIGVDNQLKAYKVDARRAEIDLWGEDKAPARRPRRCAFFIWPRLRRPATQP